MKFTEGWSSFINGAILGYLAYLAVVRPFVYSTFTSSDWSQTLFDLTAIICVLVGVKLSLVEGEE